MPGHVTVWPFRFISGLLSDSFIGVLYCLLLRFSLIVCWANPKPQDPGGSRCRPRGRRLIERGCFWKEVMKLLLFEGMSDGARAFQAIRPQGVLVSQEQRDERVPTSVYTAVRGLARAAGISWLERGTVC